MEKKLSQDLWWGEECEFCSKFQERFSQQALLTFTFLVCLQICTSLTSMNFENQQVFLWQRSCCVFCFCLLTYKYKSVKIGDQLASFYKKTFDRGVSKSIFESVIFLDCIFQKCFWAQRLVREGLIEPKWSHHLFIVSLFVFKMSSTSSGSGRSRNIGFHFHSGDNIEYIHLGGIWIFHETEAFTKSVQNCSTAKLGDRHIDFNCV